MAKHYFACPGCRRGFSTTLKDSETPKRLRVGKRTPIVRCCDQPMIYSGQGEFRLSVDDAIAKYNATNNTPHRLYLSQYTPDEIRALPAGPLLDWLACEAMGYERAHGHLIHKFGLSGTVGWVNLIEWGKDDPAPLHYSFQKVWFSSDPALVGPMMQRLRELGYADIDFSCNSSGHGVFACQRRSDPDSAIDVGGTSDPHALAVALVLAVRQQEGTANDSGT